MAKNTRELSSKTALSLGLAICAFLFLCAVQLRSYLSTDTDEGIHVAIFRTVQNGSALYQTTYFAQPPGFFLTTYPVYLLLGSTLEAARLAICLWSLAGLLAVVWFACELKSPAFGFLAIGVLYVIPTYSVQTVTFQADALAAVFSMLTLAAILRFRNTSNRGWLILSALAAGMSILTKADISVLPAAGLVMAWAMIEKREPFLRWVSHAVIFALAMMATVVVGCLPFGLTAVYQDVITLRILAAAAFPQDARLFLQYLAQMPPLAVITILAILSGGIAFFADKDARPPVMVLLAWILSTLIILLVYHPLWPHHLSLLALPVALLFSLAVYKILDRLQARFARAATLVFVAAVLAGRFGYALSVPQGILTEMGLHGVELVQAHTQPGDYVVSDFGLIPVIAGRPTPPDLTDVSLVRIKSGSLSPQAFEEALDQYQPRLILLWADKLLFMPDFDAIMTRHHYTLIEATDYRHRAYLLESQDTAPEY